MELNKQVTSLELSKKLKELGVKQESIWYWVSIDNKKFFLSNTTKYIEGSMPNISDIEYPFVYSAFTVAELLELCGEDFYSLHITAPERGKIKKRWIGEGVDTRKFIGENPQKVLGNLLVYLLENKLI